MNIRMFGCLLLLAVVCTASAKAQDVVLSAAPLKPTVNAGEVVQVKLELRNVSERSVLVGRNFALSYFIGMDIAGPEGTATWCGRISQVHEALYTILRPGARISRIVSISCINGAGYHMKKPGTYHVRASYAMPTPNKAFRGTVGSDINIPRGPVYAESFAVTVN